MAFAAGRTYYVRVRRLCLRSHLFREQVGCESRTSHAVCVPQWRLIGEDGKERRRSAAILVICICDCYGPLHPLKYYLLVL
jgi:hypothetical protein